MLSEVLKMGNLWHQFHIQQHSTNLSKRFHFEQQRAELLRKRKKVINN